MKNPQQQKKTNRRLSIPKGRLQSNEIAAGAEADAEIAADAKAKASKIATLLVRNLVEWGKSSDDPALRSLFRQNEADFLSLISKLKAA